MVGLLEFGYTVTQPDGLLLQASPRHLASISMPNFSISLFLL